MGMLITHTECMWHGALRAGATADRVQDYAVAAAAAAAARNAPLWRPSPCPAVVDGLKYAKDHEWVKVEGDVATVGITDHAQVGATVVQPPALLRASAVPLATNA